jgi:hypothetical protein
MEFLVHLKEAESNVSLKSTHADEMPATGTNCRSMKFLKDKL